MTKIDEKIQFTLAEQKSSQVYVVCSVKPVRWTTYAFIKK